MAEALHRKGQDEQKQAERVSEWNLGTILQNRLKSGLESGPYALTGPWRSPGASLDLHVHADGATEKS